MSTQKLHLPANPLNRPTSVGCALLLLRGLKMDGFDPIAICIICDSSDVVFRVPIAFVIALAIIIVRRKPKE